MTHRSSFLIAVQSVLAFGLLSPSIAQDRPDTPDRPPAAEPPATRPPAAGGRTQEIEKLIQDLGDKSFAVRENATRRLERIGKEAAPALEKAKALSDGEVRQRAEYILEKVSKMPAAGSPEGGSELQRMEREIQEMKEQVDRVLRDLEGGATPSGRRLRGSLPDEEFEDIGPGFPPEYGRGFPPAARGRSPDPGRYRGQGLGIRAREVDPTLATHLKLEKGQGVVVSQVLEGSPAGAGGIAVHDVILTFGGKAIAGPDPADSLIRAVAGAPRKSPAAVEVIRRGEKVRLEVIIDDRREGKEGSGGGERRT